MVRFIRASAVALLFVALATPAEAAPTSTSATFTLSAVGDSDLGYTPVLPPQPLSYFDPVRRALSADVVFGNLEGTMTTATTSKCTPQSTQCYAFRVPPSYAQVYRSAGFTVLNSANNHSYDYGLAGEQQTSAALSAAHITQAGLPGQIGVVTTHGIKVAFVDVAPYVLTNDMLDPAAVAALIHRAHHLARVVIVYMHSGAEGSAADHVTKETEYYYGENRGNPFQFAHTAIDEGADLVIGSGPHVLRGMQWYRGHLIAYSLGDFTNYEAFSSYGDLALSGILHVTMTAAGVITRASFTSVHIAPDGQAFFDPSHAAKLFVNQLSREDFGSSAAVFGPTGLLVLPR